jgi:uncharacterized membrane protein
MSIAYYHPQLVHFTIVLAIVGVVFRVVSLTKKVAWTGPAASTLLIAAAAFGFVTAMSGHRAHGPVERVPGAAEAVQEHEDAGDWARNALLLVGLLEVGALALGTRKAAGVVRVVSALAGLVTLAIVYEAAEHGGELVYSYAGGIGIRSGDPDDVSRLLVAGLYHRANADRAAGKFDDAARLIDELARRAPNDTSVKMLVIESQIKDRHDPAGALTALRQIQPAADDFRGRFRHDFLMADAYKAAGSIDSARAVLEALKKAVPRAADAVDHAIAELK